MAFLLQFSVPGRRYACEACVPSLPLSVILELVEYGSEDAQVQDQQEQQQHEALLVHGKAWLTLRIGEISGGNQEGGNQEEIVGFVRILEHASSRLRTAL